MREIGRAEAAVALRAAQQDRAPWFWKPSWYWFGWKTLLPVQVGHDEFCRRTILFGWTITGRAIFPLWDCGGSECHEDAIRGIQQGDVWWEHITASLRPAHPGGESQ